MKKYKVGYTTGVFDLFHTGHLELLKNSKNLCEYLIVGVSTDELVYQIKHKSPVIPLCERLEILSAICYVDKVIPQYSVDKLIDWNKYKFDVVFHGDDWKGSEIDLENIKKLKSYSVDFVYFDRGNHLSTSQIIMKIKNS